MATSARRKQQLTQPTDTSVSAYLESVDDPVKRHDAERLIELMETAADSPATMWGTSIIGFGSYHYRYASGHEGDSAAVGFSPRATAISLYLPGDNEERAETLGRLGRHKTGKGCIYVKRLSDVDEGVLVELIADGVLRAREIDAASRTTK